MTTITSNGGADGNRFAEILLARSLPGAKPKIERWEAELVARWGTRLELSHYVVRVGARTDGATSCVVRDDFAETFGPSFLVASDDLERLALARVAECLAPARSG